MKLPLSWLKEYVDLEIDVKNFEEDMTMSGSKVEAVEKLGEELINIVVGKIVKIEKHPNADKLTVAQVDIGQRTVQIVTGATNIQEGRCVPIALEGAVLAGGMKIKNSTLRGVESQGMMCSIQEFGYDTHDYPEASENGIYIFPDEEMPGDDVCRILCLKENVVEFEITSNRPDCFSILGLAREVAATYNKKLKYPEITLREEGEGKAEDMISVEIENPELCPRYAARVVKNVKIGPSPLWMRHRLTASGIRPINNIVDITNYVMLEMGQPIHAFDIECIQERRIIVRNAREGEVMNTLDGNERRLDASMLVIADVNKPVAVAGVMGGENSMVTEDSEAILFESANFNGTNIRLTSKKLGLRTDASSKYEKGLDPNQSLESINRCAQLVEILGCGEVVPGVVDCYPNKREVREVEFNPVRINALLGTDISFEDITNYLTRLGIGCKGNKAIVPTFRPDLGMEADIAEEIARLYGYNNITPTLAAGVATVGKRSKRQLLEDRIRQLMISLGFSEILNYAFESPKVFDKLIIPENSPRRNPAKILNPLGEDYSIMRTTTLNGMMTSLSTNFNKRNSQALLFETGKTYAPKTVPMTELPIENTALTIGMYDMGNKLDFFYLKAVVIELFNALNFGEKVTFSPQKYHCTHPYRSAKIKIDGEAAGFIGEVHPEVCENYNINAKTFICVINADLMHKYAALYKEYVSVPKYPAVSRDISILVKDDIIASDIEKAIKEVGGDILESIRLFDVYKGSQIGEGLKSISYAISFRSPSKTLTDGEVASQMEKIIENLRINLEAQLRDK